MDTAIYAAPKIDCHCHVFDPESFPYQPDVFYRPAGGEIATAAYFTEVMQAYGVAHALLVGPNSGYGTDNRCMLDAIRRGGGRFKGIAGIAFNVALLGLPHYADADSLFERSVPSAQDRHTILWETPKRLFGFDAQPAS